MLLRRRAQRGLAGGVGQHRGDGGSKVCGRRIRRDEAQAAVELVTDQRRRFIII